MKPTIRLAAAVSIAAVSLLGQNPARRGAGAVASLLGVADSNRDGNVSADEWGALQERLAPGGVPDARLAKVAVVERMLDSDGDGKATVTDLRVVLARLDRNSDGSVDANELGGGRAGLVAVALGNAADTDESGDVTGAEWAAFVRSTHAAGSEAVGGAELAARLVDAKPTAAERRRMQERPGAFTWGVYLLTLEAGFDANGDGSLAADDLAAMFKSADANGDGTVQRDEIAGLGRSRGRARGARRPIDRSAAPLMPWQRNLDDALALQKATGRPLLICVNIDDEPACEQLAWGRYRDPGFAKLASGFVCLIASPARHTARDYDDDGRRIADPRFGRVTSTEHVEIEPMLFERYFNGRRVAPRHLGIDKDGKVLFDIFLTAGLDPIDAALSKHGKPGPAAAPRSASEEDLLASRDAGHRDSLERRFARGDRALRLRLTAAALSATRATQHAEIVRMALLDDDPAVRRQAVLAVAATPGAVPLAFLVEAFRVAAPDAALGVRVADALPAPAAATEDAATKNYVLRLKRVFSGLLVRSPLFADRSFADWRGYAPEKPLTNDEAPALDDRLTELEERQRARPDDRDIAVAIAAATMRYARLRIQQGQNPSLLLEDVRAAARRATSPDKPNGPALAYVAWASWLLDDPGAAMDAATAAVPLLAGHRTSRFTFEALQVLARARTRALYDAMRNGTEWPMHWVADIRGAWEAVLGHPECGEEHVREYLDWLGNLEAFGHQAIIVKAALQRFPLSGKLHEYLRFVMLRDEGARALEAAYDELPVAEGYEPTVDWYAGLATLFAAERDVQDGRAGAAVATYGRCADRFRKSMAGSPGFAGSANHYVCLALSGRARLLADAREWRDAARSMQEAITASPGAAGAKDGLGRTPAENASYVHGALVQGGQQETAEALRDALAEHGVNLAR